LAFTARPATTTIELYSTDTQGELYGPLLKNVVATSE
jgi:hypothetical protein